MSEIDRVLVKELESRYQIGKTALYSRLNALGITPIKEGKRSYISGEQLAELDKLDGHIKSGETHFLAQLATLIARMAPSLAALYTATDFDQQNLSLALEPLAQLL